MHRETIEASKFLRLGKSFILIIKLNSNISNVNMLHVAKKPIITGFAKTENLFVSQGIAPAWNPVFIIGLPRAGTTLMYQMMVFGLKLSYLCNLAAKYSKSPGVISNITSCIKSIEPPNLFTSDYGSTKGWNAPNQGRRIWARWFGSKQAYCKSDFLTNSSVLELRGTIRLLERSMKAPFINKSQGHGVRLLPLNRAFPEAVFVKVHRAPIFVSRSILYGRETYFGSRQQLFSARPSNYNKIQKKAPLRQICEQIYYLD